MTLSGGLTRWVDMAQEALEPASLGPELPGKLSRRSRSNFQDGFKGGRLETPGAARTKALSRKAAHQLLESLAEMSTH